MGYAGDSNVHTPAIDHLASQSLDLDNTISCLPVCCPHRASLMTGLYPLTNGVFINDVPLIPRGQTLGEAFQQAGYQTGYIGKWHLHGSPDGHYGRRLSYIAPKDRFGFDYWKACECTHEYNHSLYYEGDDPTPKYWPGYDAIAQTEDACQYISAKATSERPFLLMLSFGPPHFPYQTAPERYRALYEKADIQLRPNVPEASRKESTEILRGYYAHMSALDDCLKQLMATLEASEIADDTIVIFTSDHGDMMLSQGLTTKMYPWEESVRVPFLLRYPKTLGWKGRRNSLLMNSPDIMPTLLSLCGIKTPHGVQGTDHSRALLGTRNATVPSSAFISYPVPFSDALHFGIPAYRGVRTIRYTYVRSIHGPWLLYDNANDPYQMHNLCGQSEMKATQTSLEAELQGWLTRLRDEFSNPDEYIKRYNLIQYDELHERRGHMESPWGDWETRVNCRESTMS
jgi:arylsulfatase A-like enzyme